MHIEFTKEQFKDLLRLVYLGNWMVNSIRIDDVVGKYNDLTNHIYSHAKDAGLEDYVDHDETAKKYCPGTRLEEDNEVEKYLDEYNDENFWDELIHRLSARDVIEKYGEDLSKKVTFEELLKKEQPFIDKYAEEFEKNGIKNLVIRK
ncbi:MAG: hypothetical protein HY758_11300 [Nitrospirae bacterium]|nr:hypothetical protein [Nitrospirota bacterium]